LLKNIPQKKFVPGNYMLTQVVQKHPRARESNQDHLCKQTSGLSRHACSPHSNTLGSNGVSSNQPAVVYAVMSCNKNMFSS
jgi:hypothetical protein